MIERKEKKAAMVADLRKIETLVGEIKEQTQDSSERIVRESLEKLAKTDTALFKKIIDEYSEKLKS